MRRLILMAAMALAALALTAIPASAQHPDFPHADFDPDNWNAVTVYVGEYGQQPSDPCGQGPGGVACEFDTGIDNPWSFDSPFMSAAKQCWGGIKGSVSHDGTLTITFAYWHQAYLPGCDFLSQPGGLPWAGKICAHLATGDLWVRQDMAFDYGGTPFYPERGVTFGRIHPIFGYGTAISFGDYPPSNNGNIGTQTAIDMLGFGPEWNHAHATQQPLAFDGHGAQGIFPANEDPNDPQATPCGWPELQA